MSKNSISNNPVIKVVAIGGTGVGKSALLNVLSQNGHNAFESQSGTKSVTVETKGLLYNGVMWIDTPGIGSSDNKDTKNITQMVMKLREVEDVHLFLLVINSEVPRISEHMQAMIDIFVVCFGRNFLTNAALVFTHWSRDDNSHQRRKLQGTDEALFITQFNQHFRDQVGTISDIPCYFLDAIDYQRDQSLYETTLEEIRNLATSFQQAPFVCKDVQRVLSQNENLKAAMMAVEDAAKASESRAREAEAARIQAQEETTSAVIARTQAAATAKAAELRAGEAEIAKHHAEEEARSAVAAKKQTEKAAEVAELRAKQAEKAQLQAEEKAMSAEMRAKKAEEAQLLAKEELVSATTAKKQAEDAAKAADMRAKQAMEAQKQAKDAVKAAEVCAKDAEKAQLGALEEAMAAVTAKKKFEAIAKAAELRAKKAEAALRRNLQEKNDPWCFADGCYSTE